MDTPFEFTYNRHTAGVLAEVAAERARQDAKWGEQNHPDGTGRNVPWSVGVGRMSDLAERAKAVTDTGLRHGTVTWQDITLEEVLEAFAESDPARLRTELIQLAAVATQWAEAIDRRAAQSAAVTSTGEDA